VGDGVTPVHRTSSIIEVPKFVLKTPLRCATPIFEVPGSVQRALTSPGGTICVSSVDKSISHLTRDCFECFFTPISDRCFSVDQLAHVAVVGEDSTEFVHRVICPTQVQSMGADAAKHIMAAYHTCSP
jgi:hypothetical protein